MRKDANPMRDAPTVTDLMTQATNGDKPAWDALVDRYTPLIWAICQRHRLSRAAANDVGQAVWLQAADQLATVCDPAALAGWLATTTQRECRRVRHAERAPQAPGQVLDAANIANEQTAMAEQELARAERNAALREAFTHLPQRCQQLITMLIEDPPVPDAKISTRLGVPVSSIALYRSRCLAKLRHHLAIALEDDLDGALEDDLDGGPAGETLRFGVDGSGVRDRLEQEARCGVPKETGALPRSCPYAGEGTAAAGANRKP
jgi:RNA polymerase sigma factor (sigma-70 family)